MLISVVIVIVLLVANEYYYHIVLSETQEYQIKNGVCGNYDRIAFGSSYGRYALSFDEKSKGFNFCVAAQFFYYTDLMLRDIVPKCLNKNGIVYIIIPDLIFAKVGKGLYGSDRYSFFLSKQIMGSEYSTKDYLKYRLPLFSNRNAIKDIIKHLFNRTTSDYNIILSQQTYQHARKKAQSRCDSWCKQFGLKNTQSSEIPEDLQEIFSETRKILEGMIGYCLQQNYRPVLVVTPVSKAMNDSTSDEFIQTVLLDNINKANTFGIPVLNYLKDQRFQDISLYCNNSDCLNATGRRMFTALLLKDTEKFVK